MANVSLEGLDDVTGVCVCRVGNWCKISSTNTPCTRLYSKLGAALTLWRQKVMEPWNETPAASATQPNATNGHQNKKNGQRRLTTPKLDTWVIPTANCNSRKCQGRKNRKEYILWLYFWEFPLLDVDCLIRSWWRRFVVGFSKSI